MNKILLTTIAAATLGLTSCSDYLDINNDPTSPSEDNITTSILMPGVEMNIASSYGNFMRITGGYYAQHYAQDFGTSNYIDYSSFYMSATRSSSCYEQLMQRAMSNNATIMNKSKDSEPGTYLAAVTLKAFTFQSLVDCYGEVPYTEALNADITSPKYDDGATIYRGIISELEGALANVQGSEKVATNFLYPGETAGVWVKFAKSLELRILTRCVDKLTDLQPKLDSLIAANEKADESIFISSDVQWANCWSSESGSESPFYAEEFATNWGSTQINVIPNVAILGTMVQGDYTDPRTECFWTTGSNGGYNGYISSNTQIVQGTVDQNGTSCDVNYFSRPQASYDMPVVILSLSDVDFYLSEYYAKKNNEAKAAEYYEAAVLANCEAAGVSDIDASVATIMAKFPYSQSNWKKSIGIQKWIANAGFNGYEAWCEMRRLGYPTFENPSVTGANFDDGKSKKFDPSSYVPGTIYTPRAVRSEIGANNLLQRWPYPEYSTARNSNAPAFPGHTTPVFWAAK